MPYKEKETRKLYYTIGEVAGLFGVNTSLIRFYEKEFEIIKPHKNKKGNRLFTEADVEHFRMIFHLVKEKGHSLASAKEIIKTGSKDEEIRKIELVQHLKHLRQLLLELSEKLSSHQ